MEDKFAHKVVSWDNPMQVKMAENFVRIAKEYHTFSSRDKVIELGCGTGLVGLQIAPIVEEMVMVDNSTSMINRLKEKIEENKQQFANISVINGEFFEITDSDFDSVISFMTLHHIEKVADVFSEIFQKLIPGGEVVIGDLLLEDGSFHSNDSVPHNGFEPESLAEIARGVGFVDIKTKVYDNVSKKGKDFPLFILTARR